MQSKVHVTEIVYDRNCMQLKVHVIQIAGSRCKRAPEWRKKWQRTQTKQTVYLIAETVTRTAMKIAMGRTAQKISLPTRQQTATNRTDQQTVTDRINPVRIAQVLTYLNKNTDTENCI